MWKKDDLPTNAYSPEAERAPRPDLSVSSAAPVSPAPAPSATSGTGAARTERASIGRSITIRGDVTGDEDLLIQGRVDGSIDLKQHSVTIGREGEVKASIAGRVVIVEGSVEGNIRSEEQVVLRSTARVQGDITAPRLVLEDGARFRGGVDMGDDSAKPASNAPSTQSQANRPGTSTPSSPTAANSSDRKASDKPGEKGESSTEAGGAKRKGGSEAVAEATA
jgi:cytoskeletal protein CcmA (bactofilin family)